jgi:hypothetical protein
MAYLRKEDKEKIVDAVKSVLPEGWKATFAVKNLSGIVMTIKSTPLSLSEIFTEDFLFSTSAICRNNDGEITNIPFTFNSHFEKYIKTKEIAIILEKINKALNLNNENYGDSYKDDRDVGHYVEMTFGNYKTPYVKK